LKHEPAGIILRRQNISAKDSNVKTLMFMELQRVVVSETVSWIISLFIRPGLPFRAVDSHRRVCNEVGLPARLDFFAA